MKKRCTVDNRALYGGKVVGLIWIRFAAKRCDLALQNRHGPHSKCENVRSNQFSLLLPSRFRYLPYKEGPKGFLVISSPQLSEERVT